MDVAWWVIAGLIVVVIGIGLFSYLEDPEEVDEEEAQEVREEHEHTQ